MVPSQFNSLFELFTVFNFAYAISDTFHGDLNKNIIRGFTSVKKNLDNVSGKLNLAKETLTNIQAIETAEYRSKDAIEDLKQKHGVYESKFEEIKSTINKEIDLAGLTRSFKFLCLFNALYCIVILLIFGFFDNPNPTSIAINDFILSETIIIINISTTVFLILCLYKDRLKFKVFKKSIDYSQEIGYRFTLIWFGFTGIIAFAYYLLDRYWLHWHIKDSSVPYLIICWSLLLPIFHFLFYFFRAYKNSTHKSSDLAKPLNSFEIEFDQFHKEEIEKTEICHTHLEKYKVNNQA